MNLLTSLPFLSGWKYENHDFGIDDGASAIVTKPGRNDLVFEEKSSKGWLLFFNYLFSNPYAEASITAPPDFHLEISPWVLVNAGLTLPDNMQFWCKPATIPNTGRVTVAASEQAAGKTLGTTLLLRDYPLSITALPTNKGNIYVAPTSGATTLAANRKTIAPGDTITLKDIGALSHVWISSTVAGEGIEFVHEYIDATNSDASHAVNFSPAYPIAFNNGFALRIFNPSLVPSSAGGGENGSNNSLFSYHVGFIKITDQREYLDSLLALQRLVDSGNEKEIGKLITRR